MWLSALISAVAALANSGLSYYLQKRKKEDIDNTLSGSQLQSFELNSQEAAKARQFNLEVDSNKYQREVADMRAAGVNPALAMNGGVSTQASTSATGQVGEGYFGNGLSSVASLLSSLTDIPLRAKSLQIQEKLADSQIRRNEAEAAGQEIRNSVDARTAYRNAEASIAEIWSRVGENNSQRKQAEAQASYLREVTSQYPGMAQSIIALNLARVQLSDAQRQVAETTFDKLTTEVDWLPEIYAAQIANYYAAANHSNQEALFARWSTFRTVTWSEAQSLGVHLPFGMGTTTSLSSNTPVSIIATADGKGYEVVSIGVDAQKSPESKVDQFNNKLLDNTWNPDGLLDNTD